MYILINKVSTTIKLRFNPPQFPVLVRDVRAKLYNLVVGHIKLLRSSWNANPSVTWFSKLNTHRSVENHLIQYIRAEHKESNPFLICRKRRRPRRTIIIMMIIIIKIKSYAYNNNS